MYCSVCSFFFSMVISIAEERRHDADHRSRNAVQFQDINIEADLTVSVDAKVQGFQFASFMTGLMHELKK